MYKLNQFVPKSSFTSKLLPFTTPFFRESNFPKNFEAEYNKIYKERILYNDLYIDISKKLLDGSSRHNYLEKIVITSIIHKSKHFIILENNTISFNKTPDLINNYILSAVYSDFNKEYVKNYKINFNNFKDGYKLDLYNFYNDEIKDLYNKIYVKK